MIMHKSKRDRSEAGSGGGTVSDAHLHDRKNQTQRSAVKQNRKRFGFAGALFIAGKDVPGK